jgi:hypothetical protein
MLNIVSTKETVEGVEGQHGLAKGGGGGDAAGGGERSTLDVRRQRSDCTKSIFTALQETFLRARQELRATAGQPANRRPPKVMLHSQKEALATMFAGIAR